MSAESTVERRAWEVMGVLMRETSSGVSCSEGVEEDGGSSTWAVVRSSHDLDCLSRLLCFL